VPPSGGEYASITDPSTGEPLARVAQAAPADVETAIASARDGFARWRAVDVASRARVLTRIAQLLRERADELADLESRDTGQALAFARYVAGGIAARRFEFFAGLADKIGGRTIPMPGRHFDYTVREPLGVTAHIIPWNGPLWVGTRTIAPALAAGNSVVLKPGEEALLTMLRLAEIAIEAGLPPGTFNVVPGRGAAIGSTLVSHPDVRGVSFTGSVSTGRRVMQLAAASVTPVVLELGGKTANIVFEDANLEKAALWTVKGIFSGAGQVCVAGSRLLVQDTIADAFIQRVVSQVAALRVGPGLESPDMGPIITEPHLQRIVGCITRAREQGARLVTGGQRVTDGALGRGYFLQPTVFDRVDRASALFQDEIFGPVLAIVPFRDEAEAVALANDTPFGLAAAVWTRRMGRALDVAAQLEAGSIYVNRFFSAGIEAPAGGYRLSGFGRLDGIEAIDEFTQEKNVTVDLDD
jgi:acyl-CoA reductase-like NAD-dependent aldehyde dehydrogenase